MIVIYTLIEIILIFNYFKFQYIFQYISSETHLKSWCDLDLFVVTDDRQGALHAAVVVVDNDAELGVGEVTCEHVAALTGEFKLAFVEGCVMLVTSENGVSWVNNKGDILRISITLCIAFYWYLY